MTRMTRIPSNARRPPFGTTPMPDYMRSDPMYDHAHIPPRIDWWRVVELVGKAITVVVMAGLLWALIVLAFLTLRGAS